MAIRPRITLKSWFYRGAKPLSDQFHDWIDSFYHKDEDKAYVGLRPYSETTLYDPEMTCVKDGIIYLSNQATTGVWNPLAWDPVGSTMVYNNADPTPQPLGGIAAGTTFADVSMQDMWTSLLYPYQYPAFTSFTMMGMPSSFEVGNGISAGSHTWTWVTSNPANVAVDSIEISGLGFSVICGQPNSGSLAIMMSAVKLMTAGIGTWNILGTNTHSGVFARSLSVPWLWRMYWGTSPLPGLTEGQVLALSGSSLVSGYSGTRHFAAAPGEYKYVAYPAAFGTATHFTDASTMLAVPFETPFVLTITNSFGASTAYNIHRSTYMLGGAMGIIVSA